jgi:hypothetical protein
MSFPQVVSTITFATGAVGLLWYVTRPPKEAPKPAAPASAQTKVKETSSSARYRA